VTVVRLSKHEATMLTTTPQNIIHHRRPKVHTAEDEASRILQLAAENPTHEKQVLVCEL
jgi:hypothetical protein